MADRRDRRGRPLHKGESQMKDGRYMYKYQNLDNKNCYVYSWRLTKNDPLVKGKKKDVPLREKEKLIQKELFIGISSKGGNMSVYKYVNQYIETKQKSKDTTRAAYGTVSNLLRKHPFGEKRVKDIKQSDARLFFVELSREGKGISSIKSLRGVLRPAFRMAYDDRLIDRNPFDFELKEILNTAYIRRSAVSKRQMRLFLDFLKHDSHYSKYYDGVLILFETGLRISEFVGLTLDDINLNDKRISIDHELMRNTKSDYYVDCTKSKAGTRVIPLSEKAVNAFRRILDRRPTQYDDVYIKGRPTAPKERYHRFLFYDKNGMPCVAMHWERYIQYALGKYNRIYKEELPKITPHVCRHTYATTKVEDGMNVKTLQYLMGHESVETTMQYYVHWDSKLAEDEVRQLDKKYTDEDDSDDESES